MTAPFTWQGCDSIPAAPRVLDLVRLGEVAAGRAETGVIGFLASFFQRPIGNSEHDCYKQLAVLDQWVTNQKSPANEDSKARIGSSRFARGGTTPLIVGQWDLGRNPKLV